MKILVVDDEGVVLDSCQRVLESGGFEVHLVASADQALEAMKQDGFHLLLIDMKMPIHDGIYLMKKVREERMDIPIVVMSGYPTIATVEDATKMGAVAFIAKPFTPDELLETVRRVLRMEGG